jgi:ribonuclease HI
MPELPDLSNCWTIYVDGSKRVSGAGAGVVLVSPQGDKMRYVLRMHFANPSNNEAEYKAVLHGMRMAKACGATRIKIHGDSNLIAQKVMKECDATCANMIAYCAMYDKLEGNFEGCEVTHIGRKSNEETDNLANIGSKCLPIPPGVFFEEIFERSVNIGSKCLQHTRGISSQVPPQQREQKTYPRKQPQSCSSKRSGQSRTWPT